MLNKILCLLNFHFPYYKYRELSDQEKDIRRKQSVSPECFMSLAPDHLGPHCRVCDLFLGWKHRESKYWFQITYPR